MELGQAFVQVITYMVNRLRKPDAVCEVLSVDKEKDTCHVKDTGTGYEVTKARLLSVADSFEKKFVVYPKVGSLVSIAYLFASADKAIVIKYSETESILLNGDEFGGLVKADVLKTELDKLREYSSTLKAATKTSLVAVDALIPGTSAAFELSMTGKSTGDFGSIKNDNVKHG